eukprot:364508-Chlamydomonas_euryale.AAC.12
MHAAAWRARRLSLRCNAAASRHERRRLPAGMDGGAPQFTAPLSCGARSALHCMHAAVSETTHISTMNAVFRQQGHASRLRTGAVTQHPSDAEQANPKCTHTDSRTEPSLHFGLARRTQSVTPQAAAQRPALSTSTHQTDPKCATAALSCAWLVRVRVASYIQASLQKHLFSR